MAAEEKEGRKEGGREGGTEEWMLRLAGFEIKWQVRTFECRLANVKIYIKIK